MKRIQESLPPKGAARHQGHLGHPDRALFASGAVAAALALVLPFVLPNGHFTGLADTADRGALPELAAVAGLSDEEVAYEIDLPDLSETGSSVDLLYRDDPWEALPDISDEECEKLLDELLQESS